MRKGMFFKTNSDHSLTLKLYFGCFLLFFLLSPYIFIGGLFVHGGLLAVILLFAIRLNLLSRAVIHRETLLLIGLLTILLIFYFFGSLIAGGNLDTLFPILLVRILVYFICGVILAWELKNKNYTFVRALEFLTKLLVFVVFINSTIIVLEYFIPPLKDSIESILYYDEGMNINYLTHSFRVRGIASAGGASLSVFHAVGALGAFWLFLRRRMRSFTMIGVAAIDVASLLVIGRTGLIILAIVGCSLVLVFGFQRFGYFRIRTIVLIIIGLFFLVALPTMANNWLPQNVYEYSVGFLYEGFEGFADEGTTSAITSFFHLPVNIRELLFGVGNFSGSFEEGISTDSGYMKTFTALGLPVSIFLYLTIPFLFFRNIKKIKIDSEVKIFTFTLVLVIAISEVKEPFLLQGYTSRFLWLIFGCCALFGSTHNGRSTLWESRDCCDKNSTKKLLYKR